MQLLRLGGDAVVYTADSANLSITDNLDLRVRLVMDDWQPTGAVTEQAFVAKRQGGDEWVFRTDLTTGRLQFVWWDTGGVSNSETASADVPFTTGTHWIRVRRSGTSVNFWTSDDDTNDHTAVTWTALGTTQTTPSGSIRSTVSTFVTIGAEGTGRNTPLYGYVYAVAVVDNVTTRADPVFASSTEWTIGEAHGSTASDGVNTWTLGGNAKIVGDNSEGVLVAVEVAFGANPFDASIIWTDITDDAESISTNRGRNYELDRFDTGTASFQIDNTSGFYHSNNTASPYYPNVRPMVPIRVRAVDDGIIYPIWYGYVERWPAWFPGNIESKVRVDASDLMKSLSLADASTPGRGTVVAALDPVAWWRFNDDTDSSASGTHDLTITGASTGDPGAWTNDSAGTFDGVNDFASIANEADIELRADMSIEMWFRPELSTTPTVTTYNTDDTWVCPAGVSAVTVEVWGGGGGGQGGDSGGYSGDGGGAGGYARKIVPVVAGTSYTIEVGTAGSGTADGSTGPAGNGGSSWFGASLVRATGGFGGQGLGIGAPGGQGTVGSIKVAGGAGGKGLRYNALGGINAAGGGGGGGSGSLTGSGQAGRSMDQNLGGGIGGNGGGTGGDGGNGGLPSLTAGQAGSAPGGAGGGGGASASSQSAGGNGTAGRVKLSYVATETQVPLSVRGPSTEILYHLRWDGHLLEFAPSTVKSGIWSLGEVTADEWHHVVVSIDWTTGRHVQGYVDGILTLDVETGYQPPVATRSAAIGRRAEINDQYFKGAISEIVLYDVVLTPQDVSALHAAQLEGFQTQPTGDRIEYALGVGVGSELAGVNLDPGQSIISGPNSPSDVSALEAIQIAADTEFGQFFIGKDGTPTFHDRHYRMIDMATPLATLDETDYETIELLGKDELKIYNDIRVSTSDQAEPFIVSDETSKTEYGRRTLDLTIYPDDENEGYDIAVLLLGRLKEPKDEVDVVPFRFYEEVSDFPTLLSAEIGDRFSLEVPLEGDDVDVDVYVERISHNIDAVSWTMEWGVSVIPTSQTYWLLGVAGSSELGTTTVLGF